MRLGLLLILSGLCAAGATAEARELYRSQVTPGYFGPSYVYPGNPPRGGQAAPQNVIVPRQGMIVPPLYAPRVGRPTRGFGLKDRH